MIDPKQLFTVLGRECLQRAGRFKTGNESYRFRQSSRQAKARIKSREQSKERAGKEVVDEPF